MRMSSSFEKSVKGGTKIKLAPPKSKYVEHILLATQSGEAGVAEVFRTLTHRLRDSTWTIVFKSLIIVHLMIKEGERDVTLRYLAVAPKHRLAINSFTDVQTQGQNIRRYSDYLLQRAASFEKTEVDHVRSGNGRMTNLAIDKGLLRETEIVQELIRALVKADLLSNDVENEISIMAFRLLTKDLLDLFAVINEAMMNVLSHFFELSRPDAERAIKIYKTFAKQTDQVVGYFQVARRFESATRLEIPKISHAPTTLAKSLQDYLDDGDFEANRRQYLAEQQAKRLGKPKPKPAQKEAMPTISRSTQPPSAPAVQQPKGPAPDLIDFFDSIEQNPQPMVQGAGPSQSLETGFMPQQTQFQQQPQLFHQQQLPQQGVNGFVSAVPSTNPFGQMHQFQQPPPQQMEQNLQFQQQPAQQVQAHQFQQQPSQQTHQAQQFQQQPTQQVQSTQQLQPQQTGFGFGGFGPQPPQQTVGQQAPFQNEPQQYTTSPIQSQQTGSNPFRQSTMLTGSNTTFSSQAPQRQSTNPFARNSPQQGSSFVQSPTIAQEAQQALAFSPQPIQAQPTGTNPFTRNTASQTSTPTSATPITLVPQPTGSTNPFRQSAFVNQQTGHGWQSSTPQGTLGGFDPNQLDTLPVFPRPGQPQQQAQQPHWS